MEFIYKKKAEKAHSKMLTDQAEAGHNMSKKAHKRQKYRSVMKKRRCYKLSSKRKKQQK
jgi:large subunit ribosomal protein L19e